MYEHDTLFVGMSYQGIVFSDQHFNALDQYYVRNPGCVYFTPLNKRIKFNQFVGMLRVADLTIEVLPKSDKHLGDKSMWQEVLLQMLVISLDVEANITTKANIQVKRHSVLETYLHLFLDEVDKLVHTGLIKKYRAVSENQTALKGRLSIQKQLVKNYVHAERFFVTHPVYDKNNIYNGILQQTLTQIEKLKVSVNLTKRCSALLLNFPECDTIRIDEKLMRGLVYDRKTESYKTAHEIAKIILFNYHPDIRGGQSNILAIMFDMNKLWENYVFWSLKKGERYDLELKILAQGSKHFWQHPVTGSLRLRPDILVKRGSTTIVIDTKWKYKRDTSIQDVRQMYAYGHYFDASKSYLLYPDRLEGRSVSKHEGKFHDILDPKSFQERTCGLLFVDMLNGRQLNLQLGYTLLHEL